MAIKEAFLREPPEITVQTSRLSFPISLIVENLTRRRLERPELQSTASQIMLALESIKLTEKYSRLKEAYLHGREGELFAAEIQAQRALTKAGIKSAKEAASRKETAFCLDDYCVYFDGIGEYWKPITIYLARIENVDLKADTGEIPVSVTIIASPMATVERGSLKLDTNQTYLKTVEIPVPWAKRAFLFPKN